VVAFIYVLYTLLVSKLSYNMWHYSGGCVWVGKANVCKLIAVHNTSKHYLTHSKFYSTMSSSLNKNQRASLVMQNYKTALWYYHQLSFYCVTNGCLWLIYFGCIVPLEHKPKYKSDANLCLICPFTLALIILTLQSLLLPSSANCRKRN